jgi:hypothetical protein
VLRLNTPYAHTHTVHNITHHTAIMHTSSPLLQNTFDVPHCTLETLFFCCHPQPFPITTTSLSLHFMHTRAQKQDRWQLQL